MAAQQESSQQQAATQKLEIQNVAEVLSHVDAAATLLKTIANDMRLRILYTLAEGELSVGELNQRIALSQSALSQHLAVLRKEGVVSTRRESQTIFYSLATGPVLSMLRSVAALYVPQDITPVLDNKLPDNKKIPKGNKPAKQVQPSAADIEQLNMFSE